MVFRYMIPRIMPVLIPQLIYLIPAFVFLEATLGMFNIRMIYPTWGRIIYGALNYGLTYGSRFWVLQPLALVFLTGLAFAMVGFALDKILNPKLESA
jgi:peptide/nickel transport system permease protein